MIAVFRAKQHDFVAFIALQMRHRYIEKAVFRLCDKGFLSCTKEGRQNLYTPLVSEEDYRQRESVGFLRRLCGGSVKNLVASLSDAGALTEQDIDELRAFLDRQTH